MTFFRGAKAEPFTGPLFELTGNRIAVVRRTAQDIFRLAPIDPSAD